MHKSSHFRGGGIANNIENVCSIERIKTPNVYSFMLHT